MSPRARSSSRELRHEVEAAAHLERARRLMVLVLDPGAGAQQLVEPGIAAQRSRPQEARDPAPRGQHIGERSGSAGPRPCRCISQQARRDRRTARYSRARARPSQDRDGARRARRSLVRGARLGHAGDRGGDGLPRDLRRAQRRRHRDGSGPRRQLRAHGAGRRHAGLHERRPTCSGSSWRTSTAGSRVRGWRRATRSRSPPARAARPASAPRPSRAPSGGGGGGRHPATGAACPAFFDVEHADRIGTFRVPQGEYRITLLATGRLTCARAATLFSRFLRDFDGHLSGGWRLDRATGTFARSAHVGFRVKEAVGGPVTSEPAGTDAAEGIRCPGTFTVQHFNRIGKLKLPAGDYILSRLRGGQADRARRPSRASATSSSSRWATSRSRGCSTPPRPRSGAGAAARRASASRRRAERQAPRRRPPLKTPT